MSQIRARVVVWGALLGHSRVVRPVAIDRATTTIKYTKQRPFYSNQRQNPLRIRVTTTLLASYYIARCLGTSGASEAEFSPALLFAEPQVLPAYLPTYLPPTCLLPTCLLPTYLLLLYDLYIYLLLVSMPFRQGSVTSGHLVRASTGNDY